MNHVNPGQVRVLMQLFHLRGGDGSGGGGVDESLSIADALNSCSSRVEDLEQALIEFTNACADEDLSGGTTDLSDLRGYDEGDRGFIIGGVGFKNGDSMSDSAQLLRASTATPLHSIQTTSIVDMASKLAQGVQKIAQKVGFGG